MPLKNEFNIYINCIHISGLIIYLELKIKRSFLDWRSMYSYIWDSLYFLDLNLIELSHFVNFLTRLPFMFVYYSCNYSLPLSLSVKTTFIPPNVVLVWSCTRNSGLILSPRMMWLRSNSSVNFSSFSNHLNILLLFLIQKC